jgi:cell wall-associated NlpC family hydrolase
MRKLTFLFYLSANLMLAPSVMANVMSQNAKGVTITFLETAESIVDAAKNIAEEVFINAMRLEGVKYKYGGASPQSGFDCSGFVSYVYERAANISLPRTSQGISRFGVSVEKEDLQVGDLVFFNTLRSAFSHVGIYVGDGKFIHAPRAGSTVRVESMQTSYWERRFNGAKRLDQVATN